MNTGIKDGKLVIDMAEADALWNGLTKDQQYEMMCLMFDPILEKATKMQRALHTILEAAENNDSAACHEIAFKALEQ
jgi:hypothetical protein